MCIRDRPTGHPIHDVRVFLTDADLAALNDRVVEIKRYHASVDAMELAYGCRGAPRIYKGRVEADDEKGLCLLVETEKRRARVPLHDSYFAEPIVDAVRAAADGDRTWDVELCGVLIGSRTRLRARLVGDGVAKPEPGWTGSTPAPLDTTPRLAEALPPAPALPEAAAAYLKAAEVAAEDEREAAEEELKDPRRILKVDEVNAVIGYPIDDFQQRSLAVITDPDLDLLAMAPTGSGKTAVALIAILQAFARGQRAVYTSPIKALSNQKFSEFTQWFRGRGIDAHVTLLTGDVKIRAPPGARRGRFGIGRLALGTALPHPQRRVRRSLPLAALERLACARCLPPREVALRDAAGCARAQPLHPLAPRARARRRLVTASPHRAAQLLLAVQLAQQRAAFGLEAVQLAVAARHLALRPQPPRLRLRLRQLLRLPQVVQHALQVLRLRLHFVVPGVGAGALQLEAQPSELPLHPRDRGLELPDLVEEWSSRRSHEFCWHCICDCFTCFRDQVCAERLAVLSRTELACIVYCTNSPNQQRRSTKQLPRSARYHDCLLYTSPSPRDATLSRMPSSA